ncbi:hypothetical protein ACOSQ3_031550 [Xanthoceras sorbifolium]
MCERRILSLHLHFQLYKSSTAKEKNITNLFKEGSIREKMGRLVSKFFIYDNMLPHKPGSHHFKNMIIGVLNILNCRVRIIKPFNFNIYVNIVVGVQPPKVYEIRHKYLGIEYKEMKEYVDSFKTKWEKYSCTIMCDGWTGPTRLSIINFMVSKGYSFPEIC